MWARLRLAHGVPRALRARGRARLRRAGGPPGGVRSRPGKVPSTPSGDRRACLLVAAASARSCGVTWHGRKVGKDS